MKQEAQIQTTDDSKTVTRLLDAAERLFGEHGFNGVGMRALATEAKMNLGATTYHFCSKEKLYVETFLRRFRPTNVERLRLLRETEVEATGQPLDVARIVECMVRPIYLLGLEHPDFHALVTRSLFLPPPFLQAALHREFEPNVETFIADLCRALPDIPQNLIRMREMFSMGAMLTFSKCINVATHRFDRQLHENILSELIRFIAARLQSRPATSTAASAAFPYPTNP